MKRINYRHFICIAITLGFVLCGVFVFSNAFWRLVESFRDLGLSVAYYFCELFEIPYTFTPTVNELPGRLPTVFLPETWEAFKVSWGVYWSLWATKENFLGYLAVLGNVVRWLVVLLLPVTFFIVLLRMAFGRYLRQVKDPASHGEESRPLKVFKRISAVTFRRVRIWFIGFFAFLREHKVYVTIWLCMWAYFFNAFTIALEALAYYFYFILSFDVVNLYRQVFKLVCDLSVIFTTVPLWLLAVAAVVLSDHLSKKRGYSVLEHHERRNRGFLNARGVVLFGIGQPGVGKTEWETDAALSYEVQLLDDALEIILETDRHFPYFPWIRLEDELRRATAGHEIYDVWSVRRWVRKRRELWRQKSSSENLFGYEAERYGLTYNDNLAVVDLWQAIEDYSCAYFIYTIQSSYLISNYSIRSDRLMQDLGNFPLWNTDFFKRDSRLIDSFSRHSHILDFDMLRLGKRMLADNPNRAAFGFGVWIIDEVSTERKNGPETQHLKVDADECNQKNDLFNICVRLSRHACVVANRVFVHILATLQRTGDLNAGFLELGDVVDLREQSEAKPVLPFWAPYWLVKALFGLLAGRYTPFYLQYRFVRGDYTLFSYLLHGLFSAFGNYCERIDKLFGCQKVKVRIVRGKDDGSYDEAVWFKQHKKVRSGRYSTDCMRAIFEERSVFNRVSLDDMAEYSNIMATAEERAMQHSHTGREIDRFISQAGDAGHGAV